MRQVGTTFASDALPGILWITMTVTTTTTGDGLPHAITGPLDVQFVKTGNAPGLTGPNTPVEIHN